MCACCKYRSSKRDAYEKVKGKNVSQKGGFRDLLNNDQDLEEKCKRDQLHAQFIDDRLNEVIQG